MIRAAWKTAQSWGIRTGWVVFLLGGLLTLPSSTVAAKSSISVTERQDYHTKSAMYATSELVRSGPNLYSKLFRNGWPTSKSFQNATAGTAFDWAKQNLKHLIFASNMGISLTESGHLATTRAKKRGQKFKSLDEYLQARLQDMAGLSNYQLPAASNPNPIYMPFSTGTPNFESAYKPDNFTTYGWANTESKIVTSGVAYQLLSEAAFARTTLSKTRTETVNRRKYKFIGDTPENGFLGLLFADAAFAKAEAVANKLVCNGKKLSPGALSALSANPSDRYIPSSIIVDGEKWKLGDSKSHLETQAAWLMATAELKALTSTTDPHLNSWKNISGKIRFGNLSLELYEKRESGMARDLHRFIFQSMLKLHFDKKRGGTFVSESTPKSKGDSISIRDAGLILLALERWARQAEPGSADFNQARDLAMSQADFLLKIQKPDGAFPQSYFLKKKKAQPGTGAISAQTCAIMGLLAAADLIDGGGNNGSTGDEDGEKYRVAAQRVLRFLEDERFKPKLGLYLPNFKGRVKTNMNVATWASILGALRESMLRTRNVRILHRYRRFWESSQVFGFQRNEPSPGSNGPAAVFHSRISLELND